MDTNNESISKSAVFYQGNLPGGLYRLRNQTSLMITGTRSNDEEVRRLDIDQLIDIARKYVEAWGALANAEVSHTLQRHLADHDQFISVSVPEALYGQPFPCMLKCTNPACSVIDFFQGREGDEKRLEAMLSSARVGWFHGRKRVKCKMPGCNGYMRQVNYSAVHRCGHIRTLTIPPGMRRTRKLAFVDTGSSIAESKFFDADNRSAASYHALQDKCSICKDEYQDAMGTSLRAAPVRNSEQLFAHNVQYLSLSKEAGKTIELITSFLGDPDAPITKEGGDIARGIMLCLTGREDAQVLIDHAAALWASGPSDSDNIDKLRADLKKAQEDKEQALAGIPTEELRATVEKAMDGLVQKAQEALDKAQGRFSQTEVFEDKDVGVLRDMGSHRRALESILLPQDTANARETLVDYSCLAAGPQQAQLVRDIDHLRDRYHIKEVAHYKRINVVMASIGFTREKKGPPEGPPGGVVPTVLNPYSDQQRVSSTPKSSIYALPAETEAIEVKLDPIAVLQWCIDAGDWQNPGPEVMGDAALAMEYLLKASPALRMDPVDVMRDTKDRPLAESAPFHLLHTISHCLVGSVKRHTGYDEKSVSEYLLPMNLSILLYVSSVQNYTSGGLRLLFEHYLSQWLDDACNYALSCAFDPVCSDKGSTCSGCVQIILGCETFNHGMSRSYIHGGKLEEGPGNKIKQGFWS
jgi:hypothetical protein